MLIVGLLAILALSISNTERAVAGPDAAIAAKSTPAGPGTPQGNPRARPEHYRGIIAVVQPTSLTLTLPDGSTLLFLIDADTRIKVPGLHGETGGSLGVGAEVMILAARDENGNLIARSIVIIPAKPVLAHRVGLVTDYTPGVSITIRASDGNVFSFELTADTSILPADRVGELSPGSLVTVIAPRDPSSLGWTALGIVVHPAGTVTATATP